MNTIQEITLNEMLHTSSTSTEEADRMDQERIKDSLLPLTFEIVRKTYRETSKEDISRWIGDLEGLKDLLTTLCKKRGCEDLDYYECHNEMDELPSHAQDLFHHIQDAMQSTGERMEAVTPARFQLLIDFLKQLEIKKNQQQ